MYVKLSEKFDTDKMDVRSVLARINLNGVALRLADSAATTAITLTWEESLILAEGVRAVYDFWHTNKLPWQHVLLHCGHVINWNHIEENEVPGKSYVLPQKGMKVYCHPCSERWGEYETGFVFRFDSQDFEG